LKQFNFFSDIINWFRPFDKDSPYLKDVLKNENEKINSDKFLDGLSQSFFMCNSDKYSFCLNIPHMPDMQKSMMMEMFNAEIESLNELRQEDELLDQSAVEVSIISQYIHDLYRFYKLHPLKNEFIDVFGMPFDFFELGLFDLVIGDQEILSNIAEFLFSKNYFDLALSAFLKLNERGDNSLEVFEKTAYCYQQLKQYDQALEFYKKAELYDSNQAWNLKKIALCYRYIGNFEHSLNYYLQAEKLEPDNLYIQTYIGHSYLDLKQFDKALDYYYKVEFMADENKKVLRPIAWCSFVLGKLENAKKYYEQLLKDEANKYDFMNLGHVEWCLGNPKAAIKNYKLSLTEGKNNIKAFLAGFDDDRQYLEKYGVDPAEIPLVLDYLKYQV
jgi:tetratricopeptide (TPR) repeat protein